MITAEKDLAFEEHYPLTRLGDPKELLFFDIETTGFSGDHHSVYLVGCIFPEQGKWKLVQWFADSPEAEAQVLKAFFEQLKSFQTVVHFNGDGFDIPFLLKRCQALGLPYDFSGTDTMDIYKHIRPLKKMLGLDSLRQKSLEHFLGIFRKDPYSGGQLVEVYEEYLMTREAKLYDMLMLHNREDLEGMSLILPILFYRDLLKGPFSLIGEELSEQAGSLEEACPLLRLTLQIPDRLPVPVRWDTALASCLARENRLELAITLVRGTMRHYYPDYRNYYYLIYEDRVVHKSLGQFVDREARRKATAGNCFAPKDGLFLPQPEGLWTPDFKKDHKDRQVYGEYTPGLLKQPEVLRTYVSYILGLS